MKLRIVRVKIAGADGYGIQTEEDYIRFQREVICSALDSALSPDEELICVLCKRILELENK